MVLPRRRRASCLRDVLAIGHFSFNFDIAAATYGLNTLGQRRKDTNPFFTATAKPNTRTSIPYCRWLSARLSATRASSIHPFAFISSKSFTALLISVVSSPALLPRRKRANSVCASSGRHWIWICSRTARLLRNAASASPRGAPRASYTWPRAQWPAPSSKSTRVLSRRNDCLVGVPHRHGIAARSSRARAGISANARSRICLVWAGRFSLR